MNAEHDTDAEETDSIRELLKEIGHDDHEDAEMLRARMRRRSRHETPEQKLLAALRGFVEHETRTLRSDLDEARAEIRQLKDEQARKPWARWRR